MVSEDWQAHNDKLDRDITRAVNGHVRSAELAKAEIEFRVQHNLPLTEYAEGYRAHCEARESELGLEWAWYLKSRKKQRGDKVSKPYVVAMKILEHVDASVAVEPRSRTRAIREAATELGIGKSTAFDLLARYEKTIRWIQDTNERAERRIARSYDAPARLARMKRSRAARERCEADRAKLDRLRQYRKIPAGMTTFSEYAQSLKQRRRHQPTPGGRSSLTKF